MSQPSCHMCCSRLLRPLANPWSRWALTTLHYLPAVDSLPHPFALAWPSGSDDHSSHSCARGYASALQMNTPPNACSSGWVHAGGTGDKSGSREGLQPASKGCQDRQQGMIHQRTSTSAAASQLLLQAMDDAAIERMLIAMGVRRRWQEPARLFQCALCVTFQYACWS